MRTDHVAEYELASAAAGVLRDADCGDALVAVQLGSGIPEPALRVEKVIPWSDLPGMPDASAPGHTGEIAYGRLGGVPLLVMRGRLHGYEGHEPHEVIRPVRAIALLGIRNLILTNATGGVKESLGAGDIVRIRDHINLSGVDPLRGIHDDRFGDRFPVTAGRAYDTELRDLAEDAADEMGVTLNVGIYGGVHGPSFETPAEVERMRAMGISVCGMSTVPEVLAATQLGLRTLVLSFVANPAGVVAEGARAEDEVLEVAARSGRNLTRIVEGVVRRLG